MQKIRVQDEMNNELLKTGKKAKHKFEELAPEVGLQSRGMSL